MIGLEIGDRVVHRRTERHGTLSRQVLYNYYGITLDDGEVEYWLECNILPESPIESLSRVVRIGSSNVE
jgi:hypothetical protein